MTWSITQVARMSKVTSRTLRHYDQIGLVTPSHVGSSGYRYYEREQLLRLQRVLLLRELGLGFTEITAVLAGGQDQVEALRVHEQDLRTEGARLARLADTVSRTITQLQGGEQMSANELFEGFTDRQARYEEQLVTEHGEAVREHFRSAETTLNTSVTWPSRRPTCSAPTYGACTAGLRNSTCGCSSARGGRGGHRTRQRDGSRARERTCSGR